MIPLHVHSNNTFLEGTIPVDKLIQRAADFGLSSIALTDTNSMHGSIQFYKLANEKGIKPIIGSFIDSPGSPDEYLILLAKNNKGYSELCKIITSRKLNDDFNIRSLFVNKLDNFFILTPSVEIVKGVEPAENIFIELIATKNEKKK